MNCQLVIVLLAVEIVYLIYWSKDEGVSIHPEHELEVVEGIGVLEIHAL